MSPDPTNRVEEAAIAAREEYEIQGNIKDWRAILLAAIPHLQQGRAGEVAEGLHDLADDLLDCREKIHRLAKLTEQELSRDG